MYCSKKLLLDLNGFMRIKNVNYSKFYFPTGTSQNKMKTLTSVFIIVTVTATVLPTIYNTFNPKPLTLKQLSICFSTRDITPIHQCNEEDYKCMVNVVSNLCAE